MKARICWSRSGGREENAGTVEVLRDGGVNVYFMPVIAVDCGIGPRRCRSKMGMNLISTKNICSINALKIIRGSHSSSIFRE